VFLICGPKGAGKTVATLALLEAGAEFISSDRAFLFRGRRSWRCTGWMASVRVAPDALSLVLPPVRSRGLKAYASQRTNQQAFHFAGKFRYPPRALLALGGWRSVPDGPLAAVVELESLAEPRERAVRARAADILKRHAIDVPLVDHLAKRAPMVAEYDDLDVPAARLTGRLGPSGLVRMFRAILTNHDRDIPFLES
jgi:hypothetical protein